MCSRGTLTATSLGSGIIVILQRRKAGLRKTEGLVKGHAACQWHLILGLFWCCCATLPSGILKRDAWEHSGLFSPAELKAGNVLPGLPLEDGERARRLQGAGCDEALARACFWSLRGGTMTDFKGHRDIPGPIDPDVLIGVSCKEGAPCHFLEDMVCTCWGSCFSGRRPFLSPGACHPGLPAPTLTPTMRTFFFLQPACRAPCPQPSKVRTRINLWPRGATTSGLLLSLMPLREG